MILNILILIFTFTAAAYKIPVGEVEFLCITPFMKRVLNQFYDYPTILYYDQYSIYVHKKPPTDQVIYLFNYDVNIPKARPFGRRFVHIIDSFLIFNNSDYLRIHTKISRMDMIIFIERNSTVPEELINKFFFVKLVFVIKIKTCKTYYCAYENYQKSCTLKFISISDPLPRFKSYRELTKFLNEVNIGYTTWPPHLYERDGKLVGIEINILTSLSHAFNFSYKLIPPDEKNNTDNVEAILRNIKSGKISWGMGGILQTKERFIDFDIPKYIFIDGYSAVFNKNIEKPHFEKFILRNLQYYSLSIISGICLCGVVYLYYKLFKAGYFGVFKYLVFLPLCDQSHSFKTIKLHSLRLLFSVWWIMCYVLTIAYKIYLFESIFSKTATLKTLENLADNGFKFESQNEDYIYIVNQCAEEPSSFCKKLIPNFSSHDNSCEAFRRMSDEKIAVIGESYSLKFLLRRSCNFFKEKHYILNFSEDKLFGSQLHFWPLEKNSILVEPFSHMVTRLEQAGVYSFWIRMEVQFGDAIRLEKKLFGRKGRVMSLHDAMLPFLLLLAGHVLALFAFIGEIITK